MKISKPLPLQSLHIRLSAETVDELKLYQRYQHEVGKEEWELKDMGGALLAVFLREGDTQFLAWRKRHGQKPAAAPSVSPAPAVNGATDV